jgi:methionyl-tRNA formyltransferase
MSMMIPWRIVVFSNSTLSLPLITLLMQKQWLAGVVICEPQNYQSQHLLSVLQNAAIPLFVFSPETAVPVKLWMGQREANLSLIFSFRYKLPVDVLEAVHFGTFNIHPSALPMFRGPCPVFWQLKAGQVNSALSIHRATDQIDAGDIVVQQAFQIHPLDTYGTLMNHVSQIAPELVLELAKSIEQGKISGVVQTGLSQCAPVPSVEDCRIRWQQMTASQISNLCRACNGAFGGAIFVFNNQKLRLIQATAAAYPAYGTLPGTVVMVAEPEGVIIICNDGAVRLDVIAAAEGGFSAVAFAERYGLDAGMVLH